MSSQGQAGYQGIQGVSDDTSQFNVISFIVEQMLGDTRTIVPVKVVKVSGGGIEAIPCTVDVQPLIKQIDGAGNATSHGVVQGLPVIRWQGGTSAIVLDPVVGDIGIVACSDRDISSVKANNGDESTPGSFRTFDLVDGIYLGGILNKAPKQYVAFTSDGIILLDQNGNKIQTNGSGIIITVNGPLTLNGDLHVSGEVIAGYGGADQVNLQTHKHGGVTTGGGVTLSPTPGT